MAIRGILIGAFYCCALFSCEKKKMPPVKTEKTTYELLTQHRWLLVEAYTISNKDGVVNTEDLYANLDSCEKDDLLIFNTDSNAVTIDQGLDKCNPGEPQASADQRWALNGNSYISYFDPVTEVSYELAIVELTETVYHTRRYSTLSDGTNLETTHKYIAY